jgi:nucleotide-binding universal stress UspA family protein
MESFERILVPVDFGPPSRAALEQAAYLARRLGARIDVLHVWQPLPPTWTPIGPPLVLDDPLPMFERSKAGQAMKELLSQLEWEFGLDCRGRLESGNPSSCILRVAEEEGYDLIVMGTHGRTGMSHLLLGSISSTVVRKAPCPVLTVRAPRKGTAAIKSAREVHHAS